MTSRLAKILQISVLLLLPALYIYFILRHFWALPGPSDPLIYVRFSIFHDAGSFRFIDRLVVAIGLWIFERLIHPAYLAAAYYILAVNSAIIMVAIFWSYVRKGFFAALLAGILIITSFHFLAWGTYVYADQTMALFALLAFICFYSTSKARLFNPYVYAGLFTALAFFSKLSGCAIVVPFAITIISERKWGDSVRLTIGFLCGALLVLSVACSLFGWDSIRGVFTEQMSEIYSTAESHSGFYNMPLSYFRTLVTEHYLPLFLSLLIFAGAYKRALTRDLYLAAMSFVALLVFLTAANMYMIATPNYIYPSVVFASLGMALYLADLLDEDKAPASSSPTSMLSEGLNLIFGLICILCVVYSIRTGITFSTFFADPAARDVPHVIRRAYIVVPLTMVGLLMLVEYSRSRISILLLTAAVCIWVPAYAGAFAYAKAVDNREFGDFFYERAPLLNRVPDGDISVYVEEWNEYYYADRLPVIYYAFFNNKKHPDIFVITKRRNIPKAIGSQILTDNPREVSNCFPQATVVMTIPWKGKVLTVLQVSKTPPEYDYRMDLSGWKGPDTIAPKDVDKTIPPLCSLGEKGVYSLTRINSEGGPVVRIQLVKPAPKGPSEFTLGYMFSSEGIGQRTKKGYVTLSVSARLSSSMPSSSLYVLDKDKEKQKKDVALPIKETSWKEYQVTKRIREEATELRFGVLFKPESKNDWIEIKDIKVAGWPSQ